MDCTCVCVRSPKGGVLLLLLLFVRLEGDGDMLSLLFKNEDFFQSRCRSPSQFSSYSRVSRTRAMGGRKPTASSNNKANKKNDVFIDLRPSEIYFTFSKISDTFSGCSKTLMETLLQLEKRDISSRDIPAVAVVEIDKPTAGDEREEDDEESDDEEEDRRKSSARKKKKKKNKMKTEKIFVSMNNRRLWVFKEAEKRGILQTIRVRLQPKEVGERLARKGSRNFRLDRISLEARIVAEKATAVVV